MQSRPWAVALGATSPRTVDFASIAIGGEGAAFDDALRQSLSFASLAIGGEGAARDDARTCRCCARKRKGERKLVAGRTVAPPAAAEALARVGSHAAVDTAFRRTVDLSALAVGVGGDALSACDS